MYLDYVPVYIKISAQNQNSVVEYALAKDGKKGKQQTVKYFLI
jgi:hypothetical protein